MPFRLRILERVQKLLTNKGKFMMMEYPMREAQFMPPLPWLF
jgi:hypothetical protein